MTEEKRKRKTEYMRLYREKNREKFTAYMKEYNQKYVSSHKEEIQLYQQENKDKIRKYREEHREQTKQRLHDYRKDIRKQVFEFYGSKCSCCGEVHDEFLTLDHINGGGLKHRKAINKTSSDFYKWVIDNDFPDFLRILCYNCNCSLGHLGYCPHNKKEGNN